MKKVKPHLGENFKKANCNCQSELSGEYKDDHRCGYCRPGSPGDGFEDRALFCFILQRKNPFLNVRKALGEGVKRGQKSFAAYVLQRLMQHAPPFKIEAIFHINLTKVS